MRHLLSAKAFLRGNEVGIQACRARFSHEALPTVAGQRRTGLPITMIRDPQGHRLPLNDLRFRA